MYFCHQSNRCYSVRLAAGEQHVKFKIKLNNNPKTGDYTGDVMKFRLLRAILVIFSLPCVFNDAAAHKIVVSLDSCRAMALSSNKELMMSRQRIQTARYQKKEAFAAYLPAFDFTGAYMYNQKDIAILGEDALLPVKTFNLETQSYEYNLVKNPVTGEPVKAPDGSYIPEQVALLPKESLTYDIHNVFFGAITLTQPIYMGGKIMALNKITGYAEQLAEVMHNKEVENVIYAVDAAYWQVVSLKAKHELAVSYVNLLDSLSANVARMVENGVATRSNQLAVDVKLNSARVDLAKVENGLTLSRMALAQVCGQPIDCELTPADEAVNPVINSDIPAEDFVNALSRRDDLKALELGIKIAGENKNVARAAMLPNVALVGAYSFSNPNMFNGFKKRFAGAFSVGAMVTIPLWHWGGNYYKYKAAESEETVLKYKLEDARELINLQIRQADYRAKEAVKTYNMTQSNLESAQENLRSATLGFHEGVMTSDDVMGAQTAWLKANSENIDAMIDIRLCNTYLHKVLGLDL